MSQSLVDGPQKTHTLYQITNSNGGSNPGPHRSSRRLQLKVQLEWTPVRHFPVKDSRDQIISFTRDYLLTSKGTSFKYQIQCIRSGRITKLPRYISNADADNIAMVCELCNT